MKFTEAITLFEGYLKQTENKLEDLKLTTLPEDKKKYFKKQLNTLIHNSIKKLNLITEGTYIALGLSLGTGFGLSLGIPILGATYGVTYGMIIGMIFGIIIGTYLEQKAKKEKRILNTSTE